MNKKAVIFPGQGAQFTGMGKGLFDDFENARSLFETADNLLGEKISDACFYGPDEKLKDTSYQQIAVFLVSAVCWDIFRSRIKDLPDFYAGLSLGEYTALYAAGVVSFEDALSLVKDRASFMAEAAVNNPSTMLAVIGLEDKVLEENGDEGFYTANLNCPGQVVISLAKDKLEEVKSFLEEKGAEKIVELQVSGGFHSPFMKEAEDKLRDKIYSVTFNHSDIPIVSNVDALPHTDKEEIRFNLIKQLTNPVLWQKSIEFMKNEGVRTFYETGPSKVLRGLLRKIDKSLSVVNFGTREDFLTNREE